VCRELMEKMTNTKFEVENLLVKITSNYGDLNTLFFCNNKNDDGGRVTVKTIIYKKIIYFGVVELFITCKCAYYYKT
jgi:hypothetical protein